VASLGKIFGRDNGKAVVAGLSTGREKDGAYLELDAEDVGRRDAEAIEALGKAKMLVVRLARLELSDPGQVQALRDAVDAIVASPDATGMNEKQLGFLIVRRIFEKGLDAFRKNQ